MTVVEREFWMTTPPKGDGAWIVTQDPDHYRRVLGWPVEGPFVPASQLTVTVEALTIIRDAMRGWVEGGVADLGPDEVFKVADDALAAM